jgi:hypothetical protein
MAHDVQTRKGTCPTHGLVDGTRNMPGHGFPFLYHWIRRVLAGRKPYRCPMCDQPVTPA